MHVPKAMTPGFAASFASRRAELNLTLVTTASRLPWIAVYQQMKGLPQS